MGWRGLGGHTCLREIPKGQKHTLGVFALSHCTGTCRIDLTDDEAISADLLSGRSVGWGGSLHPVFAILSAPAGVGESVKHRVFWCQWSAQHVIESKMWLQLHRAYDLMQSSETGRDCAAESCQATRNGLVFCNDSWFSFP